MFAYFSRADVQTFAQVLVHLGNESVPKIIINNTVNSLFKIAISILAISKPQQFPSDV